MSKHLPPTTAKNWLRQLITFSILLASSAVAAEPGMTFKYLRQTVYASGQIEEDTADRLRSFVKQNDISSPVTVALSSTGGNLI